MDHDYTAYYSSACFSNPLPHIEVCTTQCSQYDIVSFLGLVTARQLDILNTVNYSGCVILGDGGTAVVSRVGLHGTTGLALKRLGSVEDEIAMVSADKLAESRVYRTLISEVFILTHPAIRSHSHFIRVEGICWELHTSYKTPIILPVLIFEEAPHGDLARYISLQNQLKPEVLLELFCTILETVQYLHTCGFIHGDLKPQNILICENEHGILTAKLADFGFSLQGTDTAIKLPVSQGWSAPEVNDSYPNFTLEQAMQADIFSLGLILVWLMSKINDMDRPGEWLDPDSMEGLCTGTKWRNSAREIQKHGIFASIVTQTTSRLQNLLGEEIMGPFDRALKLMLSVQPKQRAGFCDEVLQVLKWTSNISLIENVRSNIRDEISSLCCGTFKASGPMCVRLAQLDYRVREHINNKLRSLAEDTRTCKYCSSNAAFQLAIFLSLGLGISPDESECSQMLLKSGNSEADRDASLLGISHQPYEDIYWNVSLLQAMDAGFLPFVEGSYSYRNNEELQEITLKLEQEFSHVTHTLGPLHTISFLLSYALFQIQLRQCHYLPAVEMIRPMIAHYDEAIASAIKPNLPLRMARADLMGVLTMAYCNSWQTLAAIEVGEEVLREDRSLQGDNHRSTLQTMQILSKTYANANRYDKAIPLIDQVAAKKAGLLGSKHGSLVATLTLHGGMLQSQHLYHEADQKYEEALDIARTSLGKDHIDRLILNRAMGDNYKSLGQLAESLELLMEVKAIHESRGDHLGDYDPEYPELLIALGDLCGSLRRLDESEKYILEALTRAKNSDRCRSSLYLRALSSLIHVRANKKEFVGLDDLGAELIELSKELQGAKHPQTLYYRKLLAEANKQRGRYAEAEVVFRQVAIEIEALQVPSPGILYSCIWDLADCMQQCGRWHEAIPFFSRAVQLSRKLHTGTQRTELLSDMDDLAAAYGQVKDWRAELVLSYEIMELTKQVYGEVSLEAFSAVCHAARVHYDLQEVHEGDNLYKQARTVQNELGGQHSQKSLILYSNLALSMATVGNLMGDSSKLDESLRIEEEAAEVSLDLNGVFHNNTRVAFMNLAYTYTVLGRAADALKLRERFEKQLWNSGQDKRSPGDLEEDGWETDSSGSIISGEE